MDASSNSITSNSNPPTPSLRVRLVEIVEKWEDRKWWEDGKVGE